MIYIIEDEVIFDNDGRSLYHKSVPDEALSVSETACRLLHYLIQNPNIVLGKEKIIEEVWGKFGFSGSGNSLSQYIAILRKYFAAYGFNQIIKTVPKYGFSFNANIEVFEYDIDMDTSLFPKSAISPPEKTVGKVLTKFKKTITCLNLSLIILLIAYSVDMKRQSKFEFKSVSLYDIGRIGACPVFTIYPSSASFKEPKVNLVKSVIHDELPCVKDSFYIFDSEDLFVFESRGRAFFSRCAYQQSADKRLSGCEVFYVRNY